MEWALCVRKNCGVGTWRCGKGSAFGVRVMVSKSNFTLSAHRKRYRMSVWLSFPLQPPLLIFFVITKI